MSNKKETAVEWLESKIQEQREKGENDLRTILWYCKQAKAMEKEQIIDFFMDASQNFSEGEANKYYKKTYEQ